MPEELLAKDRDKVMQAVLAVEGYLSQRMLASSRGKMFHRSYAAYAKKRDNWNSLLTYLFRNDLNHESTNTEIKKLLVRTANDFQPIIGVGKDYSHKLFDLAYVIKSERKTRSIKKNTQTLRQLYALGRYRSVIRKSLSAFNHTGSISTKILRQLYRYQQIFNALPKEAKGKVSDLTQIFKVDIGSQKQIDTLQQALNVYTVSAADLNNIRQVLDKIKLEAYTQEQWQTAKLEIGGKKVARSTKEVISFGNVFQRKCLFQVASDAVIKSGTKGQKAQLLNALISLRKNTSGSTKILAGELLKQCKDSFNQQDIELPPKRGFSKR